MMETLGESDLCFPHLFNASCKKLMRSPFETSLIYFVLSAISVVTTALNLLVIVSISHYKQLQTPTNFLLLSLAVSDFFVGLLMSFQIVLIDGCWYLGDIMCIVYRVLDYIITSASIGTMILISVDRYVAICDPLHYPTKVTPKRVQICNCLCWLGSAFCHTMLMKHNMEEPGRYNTCTGQCVTVIDYAGGLIDLLVSFVSPLTFIIILYMRVFVVVVSQARAMRSHVASPTAQGGVTVKKSEMKAARVLGVVIIAFLSCLCPYFLVTTTGQDTLFNSASEALAICLFYFNSCLNPLIYACFYPWFRKCLRLIFTLQILQPGSNQMNVI